MSNFNVYNFRTFKEYQNGNGEIILETLSEEEAINCANSSNYGGREICSVMKDGKEIYCTLKE